MRASLALPKEEKKGDDHYEKNKQIEEEEGSVADSFSPELDRLKQRRISFDLKFEPTFSPRDSKNYNMK